MDLLAGDATSIENKIPGMTSEKKAKLKKEFDDEMQPIQEELQKIYKKHQDELEKAMADGDKDAMSDFREKIEEETKELSEKMMALHEKQKLFQNSKSTGYVWVYLQK